MKCGKASRASCCFTATATAFFTCSTARTGRCCAPAISSTKVTWVKGFARRRQADRRSGIDRDQRRDRGVPGRRRRRKFSRRVVQPDHEAVLRARQRQLPGLHVTRGSARRQRQSLVRRRPRVRESARGARRATEGIYDGPLHPRHGSVRREESVGHAEPGRRAGNSVDGERSRVSPRRWRAAGARRQDRQSSCTASISATSRRRRR